MNSKADFDRVYRSYNKRKYVSPDPLQFLYDYPDIRDREIVALVAASLAYGRVSQILVSINCLLGMVGPHPYEFLMSSSDARITTRFSPFKHRFTTGQDMSALLTGTRTLIKEYGSLNECFLHGMNKSDQTVVPALAAFVERFRSPGNYLLPSPSKGSACKRLNLFLRWMVRKDAVDPGGWQGVSAAKLVIPLDTHMAKIGRMLKLVKRKSADMKAALELTESFRKIQPRDPVKYDFALTRFGIRSELDIKQLAQVSLAG
jgi:uncharacterized protein (TIGR02757 family)